MVRRAIADVHAKPNPERKVLARPSAGSSRVVAPKGCFWTPNGRHRLEAVRRLGAKSITALVAADREIAWQIILTIQSCGDSRPLPMNRSGPPSRITRNWPRWCSTLRRKLRQQ